MLKNLCGVINGKLKKLHASKTQIAAIAFLCGMLIGILLGSYLAKIQPPVIYSIPLDPSITMVNACGSF